MIGFLFQSFLSGVGMLLLVGAGLGVLFSLPVFRLPSLDARLTEHQIREPEMRHYAQAVEDFVKLSARGEKARLQAVRDAEQWRACLTPAQVATVLEAVVVTPIRQGKYKQYGAFVQRLPETAACPAIVQGKPLFPP